MNLPRPEEATKFENAPAGVFTAICYRFIDLGTQPNGQFSAPKHKIMLSWELCGELMKEGENTGKPFTVHKRYTWSMHEKANLRHDLKSWRGRDFEPGEIERFDTRNLLGKACTVTVTHDVKGDKTYTNVASVGPKMKGVAPEAQVNPNVYLALTPEDFDPNVFAGLRDGLKAVIGASPEYQELMEGSRINDGGGRGPIDDEIPF